MFYSIEPEVAGHFGANSIVDISVRPPYVTRFHFEMDGWMGDDIIETISTFIITERMKQLIDSSNITGYEIDTVEVTKSDQFLELYPSLKIPVFWWLKITGRAGVDDFGLSTDNCLVISDRVLIAIQKNCRLDNCEVSAYTLCSE